MNDRAAFDAYFEDHPDDIVGLLAYADFLDEQGEAREAEFTREMARLGVWPQKWRAHGGDWQWWYRNRQPKPHILPNASLRGPVFSLLSIGREQITGCYDARADAVADLYRVWCELGDATWAEPVTVGAS